MYITGLFPLPTRITGAWFFFWEKREISKLTAQMHFENLREREPSGAGKGKWNQLR